MQRSERGWLAPALAIVGAITALRLVLLAFNRTDLFVDEAQYWLWGQTLDWGYYSKPPLIAWVIRAVTDLAGSDAAFWVRMPGAILHGVTALVIGAVASAVAGPRAALATAVGYATLPMVAVGSLLFSTDTVMLPCLALSLWAWLKVVRGGGPGWAALAGLALGLAIMGKYAGLYGLAGYALAAAFVPGWRAPLRDWAVLAGVALAVVAPNLMWNLSNDLTTLAHTADNTRWLRQGAALRPGEAAGFVLSQAAVAGPLVAAALVWAWVRRPAGDLRALAVMAAIPLAAVTMQAAMAGANANWAAAAWLYAAPLVFAALADRPVWRGLSLAINGAVALALPLLAVFPTLPSPDRPWLSRYLGRVALTEAAIATARAQGAPVIVADRRDVLADLFHAGRDAGLVFRAVPPSGRPAHFYEQRHALPQDAPRPLLLVAVTAPACAREVGRHEGLGGAFAGVGIRFWVVPEGCDVDPR